MPRSGIGAATESHPAACRVLSRGVVPRVASESRPVAPRPGRILRRPCRVSDTASVPHPAAPCPAASTSHPTAPSVSPPSASRIPRCRSQPATAAIRNAAPSHRAGHRQHRHARRAAVRPASPAAPATGAGATLGAGRRDGRGRRVSRPGASLGAATGQPTGRRGRRATGDLRRRGARRLARAPGQPIRAMRVSGPRERGAGCSRALTRRRAVGRRLSTLGGPLRGEAGPPGAPASPSPGPQEGSGR